MSLHNFKYLITWSDFITRTVRPTNFNEDAQIHPEMSRGKIKLASKGKAVSIAEVDINITIVKSDCWVIDGKQNDYLLKHEQGHYDILSINAREFYNSLIGLSAASTHELQKLVSKLQANVQKNVATVDVRYDTQTKHSLDKAVQDSWNKKISAEKQKPNGSIDNLP